MKKLTIIPIDRVTVAAYRAGSHFFERDTKRFFSSTWAPRAYLSACGRYAYFWTREKTGFSSRVHRYSVRCARLDSAAFDVSTVGQFLGHPDAASATWYARRYALGALAHPERCGCARCWDVDAAAGREIVSGGAFAEALTVAP